VNLIEPGYMQTDFLTSNSLNLPAQTVDGYPAVREMTRAHQLMPGTQLGDPVKAAAAIITVTTSDVAPLHQLLGSDSLSFATSAVDALTADFTAGGELATSTDIVSA
jgi:hypothetical protein